MSPETADFSGYVAVLWCGVICMPYLRLDTGHWPIGLSSVRFKEVSARFPDKSAQVDDDFAFALGKFALTPFADCLGD